MIRTIEIKQTDIGVAICYRGKVLTPLDKLFKKKFGLEIGCKYRIAIIEGTEDNGYQFFKSPYGSYFIYKYDGIKRMFPNHIDCHQCCGTWNCNDFDELFFKPDLTIKYYKITIKKI